MSVDRTSRSSETQSLCVQPARKSQALRAHNFRKINSLHRLSRLVVLRLWYICSCDMPQSYYERASHDVQDEEYITAASIFSINIEHYKLNLWRLFSLHASKNKKKRSEKISSFLPLPCRKDKDPN